MIGCNRGAAQKLNGKVIIWLLYAPERQNQSDGMCLVGGQALCAGTGGIA